MNRAGLLLLFLSESVLDFIQVGKNNEGSHEEIKEANPEDREKATNKDKDEEQA